MEKQSGQTPGVSRRQMFKQSSVLAAIGAIGASTETAASAATTTGGMDLGANIYESIGVKPMINARGTFTIITGSQSLPEVKRAMEAASHHYVHLDELMEAAGKRLAELTQSEWGLIVTGCAAAATHVTAACIAGTNPERMTRLPSRDGLKNEVIMPRYARNQYDHATRMLGVTVVEVETEAEYRKAVGPQTAMVLIMSCPEAEKGELSIPNMCRIAKEYKLPVFVDAAAENLTIPNTHLANGATVVAYSGGKCMRGPQTAGLVLGNKQLLRAAWLNSAPHHAFGRSIKVGKEEIMGMLAAVEMWTKRDHEAEWKTWVSWLDSIKAQVATVPGTSFEVLQPEDLSNHAPRLKISWDAAQLGITGKELEETLLAGTPRITIGGSQGERPNRMKSAITIMPYMMMPDDHKIVGKAIKDLLAKPPKFENPVIPTGEPAAVAGIWDVDVTFTMGSARHRVMFEQKAGHLTGLHEGETVNGKLMGELHANQIRFRSAQRLEGNVLSYDFKGTVQGDTMSGEVALGEYGKAQWTAKRFIQA